MSSPAWGFLQVYHLEGTASYQADQTAEWQELEAGDTVPLKARVNTSEGAYLQLNHTGSNYFRLNELTGVELQLPQNYLELSYGSFEVQLDSPTFSSEETQFKAHTPNAILGVRGTSFQLAYELDDLSWVGVDTGELVVKTTEEDYLGAGQGADVEPHPQTGEPHIGRLGEPRAELTTTWQHWSRRYSLVTVTDRVEQLQQTIEGLQTEASELQPGSRLLELEREIAVLKQRLENLQNQLQNQRQAYQNFQDNYLTYRQELAERRADFIERRKQAFKQFEEQRQEQFEDYRQQRQQRLRDRQRRP